MMKTKKKVAGAKRSKTLFTKREIETIQLICRQYSNKEIARKLKLSHRTVEGYRERIRKITKAKNSVGILLYAIKHGMYKI